ncbi:Diaminobutyrate--2-oxoglutarate transaminase [Aliarcobacter thereius]|uniref:Diaminobutyrate--2-oxoglutarate transaminase n=2 Tax=Aliarcobacter thereius TaxID=544718 RepID=A0A1C0B9T1_9BACT|nr:diaminobutyrate--2-oxoglutarate transaminase [Aliarcobacter thereius]OCL88504.1 Diaminobutyrate--2-oxoglutarate transaminase [Aliarcobacter thereius]OCL91994.1 Diaminobutyrate--2-oxoglutarate transaminase [Aliarcobacter thereius]OCL94908.1 Diaminobutyrate--2-oxoglutarate transaminase [Aliarcobacter thereius LMG 24486]OCM00356.1 Diaminobutyrate--2-oxoglutarate transaminase [Aliarcobacter thereius]QBF15220.1 diaminobutyrate-2-oxoglutarate transaminase [Aliarcobacter thereius LMG 24486]
MRIFEKLESEVRGYIRNFPTVFEKAKGSILTDEQGVDYIDFFAGAGTLNYGHNNQHVSDALLKYIQNDGIIHGLDMATKAKKEFLQSFESTILKTRNLEYKVQFTGPTGTNAVETALKLARLVKKRSNVVAFTNGYHGLSQGSLAVTGNNQYRDESYISRINATFMPFDGYFDDSNTLKYFRKFIEDSSSGVDLPAAVIVETIQGEGGINVASKKWLQELDSICKEFDILLIIDDIQVGNGRSGEFFSFEFAGIKPDMITLSKSIGGGLPMALLLFRPDLDQWKPGEHTGTFRGNNLAFVASKVLIETYWKNDNISKAVKYKEKILKDSLEKIANKYKNSYDIEVRGRGLVYGFEIKNDKSMASDISKYAFEEKLIIETCGSESQVVKFLPPLLIEEELLKEGLARFEKAVDKLIVCRENNLKGEF